MSYLEDNPLPAGFAVRLRCPHGRYDAHGMRGKGPNRCPGGRTISGAQFENIIAGAFTEAEQERGFPPPLFSRRYGVARRAGLALHQLQQEGTNACHI